MMLNFFFRIEDKREKEKGKNLFPYWDNLLGGFADDILRFKKRIKLITLLTILAVVAFFVVVAILTN